MRGLKLFLSFRHLFLPRRTLRGCVDWNYFLYIFAGNAFSRTLRGCVDWNSQRRLLSPPPFSRTLRGCVDWNKSSSSSTIKAICRTLRGCVDWNRNKRVIIDYRLASHPSRVRGLKYLSYKPDGSISGRRTLRGCVDWNKEWTHKHHLKSCRTLRGCVDWNHTIRKLIWII